MLSVNYTPLQRKIVSEVQQTEIEKLAESFKLAGVWTHPGRRSKTFLKSMADSFNFLGFLFIPAPFLFSSATFLSDLSDKFCSGHNGLLAKDSEG